jgi:hypothetical protein
MSRRRRRLPRILLNAATAASLVLCVASGVLWVRTRYILDDWRRTQGEARLFISTPRGELAFVWLTPDQRESSNPVLWTHQRREWADLVDDRGGEKLAFRAPGLEFWTLRHSDAAEGTVVLRLWLAMAVFALLPILYAARSRRGAASGHCPACGYDLRATPDRCPECGTSG